MPNQDMDLESLAKELHGESTVNSKNNQDSDSNSDDNYPQSKYIKQQN